jgi:glucokinase
MKRKVLVVDIGGTHVKLLMCVRDQREHAYSQINLSRLRYSDESLN